MRQVFEKTFHLILVYNALQKFSQLSVAFLGESSAAS